MYTVKQAAEKAELSEHTLRFYANEGLFPHLQRDKNGVRLFSDEDMEWVSTVKCLRAVGMPVAEVKNYIRLCMTGESTLDERYAILARQKEQALQEQAALAGRIAHLECKLACCRAQMEARDGQSNKNKG